MSFKQKHYFMVFRLYGEFIFTEVRLSWYYNG